MKNTPNSRKLELKKLTVTKLENTNKIKGGREHITHRKSKHCGDGNNTY